MLGRQQIAGIPTALSELFKNAYDAYATRVRADYFPTHDLLLLRDDGIGMSPHDFESRWLTIGTDSKARGSTAAPLARPPGAPPRTQMGEKGIGRLAVASIAPQLVLITKALTTTHRSRDRAAASAEPLLIALVQWTLFEIPGLTLDDVVVPVRLVAEPEEVSVELLTSLGDEVRTCLRELGNRVPDEYAQRIREELTAFSIDPRQLLSLAGPKYGGDNHGTAFLLSPLNEDLPAALRPGEGDDKQVSPFQRFLSGFNNTMLPDSPRPAMQPQFILHDAGTEEDLIDPEKFWSPEDFTRVDHVIQGSFDERGQFSGSVSVYQGDRQPYTESWTAGRGRKSRCGPFRLTIGYLQGSLSDSSVNAEDFTLMTDKLNRLGGIYVYRDDIRVLPYGNSDVDYLEIEQRRSLKASRAFFSYRRMFGAIEVSAETNPELQEKAGREGFRDNAAYRDFVDILKSLLGNVAADFFVAGGEKSEDWLQRRTSLKERASARRDDERRQIQQRQAFLDNLADALNRLESGEVRSELSRVVLDFDKDLRLPPRVRQRLRPSASLTAGSTCFAPRAFWSDLR